MKITSVKGMHDLLPTVSDTWGFVEQKAHAVFRLFGYREIRTPILEKISLFTRSVGQSTDLVEKEMYAFVDQGDEELALRPEGTAPVVRALVQHGALQTDPLHKVYYLGPMFRRERPQKGRYRQFHQIGVELFGAAHPFADAEVMAMLMQFLAAVGVDSARLEVNSLGCPRCRPRYYEELQQFLSQVEAQLCKDCQRRMTKNPMRVFDCKHSNCIAALTEAPTVQDYWCEECGDHFHQVCSGLEAFGVQYWVNHRIARGLDYYVRTAFEVMTHHLGAQNSICGGGRYDGLVKELGGPEIPGVGFAIGMERLMMLLEATEHVHSIDASPKFYFAALGDGARAHLLPLVGRCHAQGIRVEWDYEGRSLKAQMKRADRLGATEVVILGDDELASGKAIVRNMISKDQQAVALDALEQRVLGS